MVESVLHYLPTQRISWNVIIEITKRWKLKKFKQKRKHWMNGSLLIHNDIFCRFLFFFYFFVRFL